MRWDQFFSVYTKSKIRMNNIIGNGKRWNRDLIETLHDKS